MSLAALLQGAPFSVRLTARDIVEDRHGASAFVIVEPLHFPAERYAAAEAWVDLANAEADRQRTAVNPLALPQAAE